MEISIRLAETRDIPLLRELIEASVRGLQSEDYSAAQLEKALQAVYGVDTQLIADQTYFAAEKTASTERLCWWVAGVGASGRLCTVAIGLQSARTHYWIRQQMRQRFGHFLFTRSGRDAGLAE
jgi:hypothetical protein